MKMEKRKNVPGDASLSIYQDGRYLVTQCFVPFKRRRRRARVLRSPVSGVRWALGIGIIAFGIRGFFPAVEEVSIFSSEVLAQVPEEG
jgi:hypothetical protein